MPYIPILYLHKHYKELELDYRPLLRFHCFSPLMHIRQSTARLMVDHLTSDEAVEVRVLRGVILGQQYISNSYPSNVN